MPKYIVSQTADVDISYIVEAENLEEALTYGKFDLTKVVSVDQLSWDKPYDAELVEDGSVFRFLTQAELEPYMKAGIL